MDPAPSVSNIFFGCWIVWSVPHQYHDKNMLGQYWILPHQYHINFFVLGQSWILPHQYQIFFLGVGLCGPCPISITTKICLDNTGSCPISITLIFLCLDNRGSCPISEKIISQIFFLGVGLCGPCPISITTKICLDNTGSCPISITLIFCAWTIVDPAPSVSNIFFGCWIVWTVPHEYQVKKIIIYTKCLDNRG